MKRLGSGAGHTTALLLQHFDCSYFLDANSGLWAAIAHGGKPSPEVLFDFMDDYLATSYPTYWGAMKPATFTVLELG